MKLPEAVKPWVSLLGVLLLGALFIGSYFAGKQYDKEQALRKQQAQETTRPVQQYEPQATSKPQKQEVNTITEESLTKAQEAVRAFLKAYVPFDSQQPDADVERSKPYITDVFYKRLASVQKRGTLTAVRTELVNIFLTPAEMTENIQWYNADMRVRHTDIEGKVNESILLYIVKAINVDGIWKVDDSGTRVITEIREGEDLPEEAGP